VAHFVVPLDLPRTVLDWENAAKAECHTHYLRMDCDGEVYAPLPFPIVVQNLSDRLVWMAREVYHRYHRRLGRRTGTEVSDWSHGAWVALAEFVNAEWHDPVGRGKWGPMDVNRFVKAARRAVDRACKEFERGMSRERGGVYVEAVAEAPDRAEEWLESLPEELRAAARMCWLEGRTQEEAAAALGVNKRTVQRRLERAKEELASRIKS
jgi:RNA polymerase sigma factor (sigma-70 family)